MRLLVLLIMTFTQAHAIWCVDGTDCDTNCGICEGAGCLRIIQQHPTKGPSMAQTCLPHDAYIHVAQPEGCRTDLTTHKRSCFCLDSDFCNGIVKPHIIIPMIFTCLLLLY